MNIARIPLGTWVDKLVDWITVTFAGLFSFLTRLIEGILNILVDALSIGPPVILIIFLTLLVAYTSKWKLGLFTVIALLLIDNLGYWEASVQTLALVLSSALLTIAIGIPIGIWAAQSSSARKIIIPTLDFMQTMPAFVYLIPAILFFGIGVVPGIFASIIFAVAPTIRLTNLGIQEVPKDLIEASDAFGSTSNQKLFKVQLPLAAPTIFAGINQSIMLALSMVVIASLVGAPGLGAEVYRAVAQIKVGQGFEAGLSIVIIAIILDRITQNLRNPAYKQVLNKKIAFSFFGILFLAACIFAAFQGQDTSEQNPNSVGSLTDYEIIGIDPGAGIMKSTNKAMEDYKLDDWTLVEGSSAAMTAELKKAYNKKEPIIITGWTPHWMFQSFDLKYLKDPKNSFGKDEDIHTITRKGLEKDAKGAYTILDQFFWESSDMEEVMADTATGMDPKEAAEKWIAAHPDKVTKWTDGAKKGNGESISLVYVAWESEIASTNVIGKVLEQQGYDVTLKQVEIGPMFAGIANGSADAMVAAWLPTTSAEYYEEYKDDIVDLGPNLRGTKLGLVVPTYMDIDSIEDLNK
ncbi:glycine betaine ABC transporter substrate-binding protein [Peribacillus sp. NPDC097675]|uniref:glycine betaine ABC transporter substrate-binding protein n=1 Tax=Peribacillus sp. NPDC097675 TaxID=3390618 RepID=UPI003CFCA9B8